MSRLLVKLFHLCNPLLWRGAAIYAEMIARLIALGVVPDNAEIILQGSGAIPNRLKKSIGAPRIILKADAGMSLTAHDFSRVIACGLRRLPHSQQQGTPHRVFIANQAIVVEVTTNNNAGSLVSRMARAALRDHYRKGTDELINLHRQGIPAAVSPAGASLSTLRKKLMEDCLGQAVKIAQEELERESGWLSHQFAVILAAGAVRDLSLVSDLDYMFVCESIAKPRGKSISYFDHLAQRTEQVLTEIDIKSDNLLKRFTKGRRWIITVDETRTFLRRRRGPISLLLALLEKRQVEQVGSRKVYKTFCAQADEVLYGNEALKLARWRTLYVRQFLRRRLVQSSSLPSPQVWLRDLTICYQLAGLYLRLHSEHGVEWPIMHSQPLSQLDSIFEQWCLASLMTSQEKQQLLEAYEFFMKVRNEAGLCGQTAELTLREETCREISPHLGYGSVEDFRETCKQHACFVSVVMRRIQQQVGHKQWQMAMLDVWSALVIKLQPVVDYLLKGDARVVVRTMSEPPLSMNVADFHS